MKKICDQYLVSYYPRMLLGCSIKFLGALVELFLPWTLAHVIDVVTPTGRLNEIFLWGLFMLLCSVLALVFNVTANRMACKVAGDAIYEIRGDLFAKVMYLSNEKSDLLTRPSILSRLTSDTYNLHQMLARIQRLGIRAPILLFGGLTMTMLLDPVLAMVLVATLPLLTVVVIYVSRRSIPLFTKVQENADELVRLVREDIAGIRVIKALSKEDHEMGRFEKINQEMVNAERKAAMTTAITNPVMTALLNIGLVGVIIVGAYRVNAGTSEVGKILAFMTYFTIILNALLSVSKIFTIVSKAVASANRIEEILETRDERQLVMLADREEGQERPCHVEFDHVSFSYNKNEDNITDINFRLERGETLGIIGSTGSGKTTILNLLMRFYDCDRGTIRIDGKDIRTMDLKDLRSRFGVVFQNDTIFEDTIYANINMGRGLTMEEAKLATVYARASEFVEEKGGVVGALDIRGANLSGGQKQRILISRALAAKPEILVLDDSSSALDYKTDAALRQELREHFADTTCLVIAQRVSSVMYSDHILVLEDGEVIGYGKHEELLESCPVYKEISNSQMGE